MTQSPIAEPDHDFQITHTLGIEQLGKNFLTSEVAILKCTQGHAVISLNSREHSFVAGSNFLLSEAMLFKIVSCSDDCMISTCRFSLQFMNAIYPQVGNKILDVAQHSAPDIYSAQQMVSTNLIFSHLCVLHENKNHTHLHRIAIHLVLNYFLEIYEITHQLIKSDVVNTSIYVNHMIGSFCGLCHEFHNRHRNVEYYAQKLNISSRYLYKITKDAFQLTPKQLIDYYVSGTAKKLILTSVLNNQQIADRLNFPDQATFGQFFKRNVGLSPSEFRNRHL